MFSFTSSGLFFDIQYQSLVTCLSIALTPCISAEYVVEFEDQASSEGWEELKRVRGDKERVSLHLWPYMSYRFRVIAVNDVGKSSPSKPSDIHNTPAEGLELACERRSGCHSKC